MIRSALLGAALATAVAAPALAADVTRQAQREARQEARQELRDNRLTDDEKKLLRSYYKFERKAEKANGTGGRPNLPKGWRNKLDKGWTLDPAIVAASSVVPADVVKKLGPQPAGTRLLQIEDRVIRVDGANKVQDAMDLTR